VSAPSSTLTTTSYALLGLLSLRPWTSYELAQQMQRTLGFIWPRAERKIYDEPKRLEGLGLATAVRDSVGKRPRTTYAITDAGRAALEEWLTTDPEPSSLEFEGMLRVLFADQGDVASLRRSLRAVQRQALEARNRLAAMSAEIAATDGGAFPDRVHVNALGMRFMIDHYTLVHDWAGWAIEETASWNSVDRPPRAWRATAFGIFGDAAATTTPLEGGEV
jgi:PadR family transcriptional regulator AphA